MEEEAGNRAPPLLMDVEGGAAAAFSQPSPSGSGPGPSPEKVRRQWDALLAVINDVSQGGVGKSQGQPGSGGASSSSGRAGPSEVRAAQELLTGISAQSPHNSGGGDKSMRRSSSTGSIGRAPQRKLPWDERHQLAFSVCNDQVQKNTRNYFDRPREIEMYGTKDTPPLEPVWSLAWRRSSLPSSPTSPNLGSTLSAPSSPGGASPPASRGGASSQVLSPKSAMSRSATNLGASLGSASQASAARSPIKTWTNERPNLFGPPLVQHPKPFHQRHSVVFSKDNSTYHANCREYFDRPKRLIV